MMEINISIEGQIKPGQLNQELQKSCPGYQGLSYCGPKQPLRLFFEEGTPETVFDQADAIVSAHEPGPDAPPPLTFEERLAALEKRVEELERKGK